jgi:transketolase
MAITIPVGTIDMRDAFFDEIYKIGKADPNVVFITDDMDAFGLRAFKRDFPERFVNIGVAEQNLVNVASGLAACGKKVFIYGICSFMTSRCFEQIKINICGMGLPVTIIGVGAGFSFGFDGTTHHGIQDVALMRTIPEMAILNPSDAASAAACARWSYEAKGPTYVRLDKGTFPEFYAPGESALAEIARGFKIVVPPRAQGITIVSTGYMTSRAVAIAGELEKQNIAVGVVDLLRVKPVGGDFFTAIQKSKGIVTLEENSLSGGIGTALSELLADKASTITLWRLGVADKQFLSYGSRDWFHQANGIDVASVVEFIKARVGELS